MDERKGRALILIAIGMILLKSPEPLSKAVPPSAHLLLAGLYFLGPLGLIFLVLGLYRYNTKYEAKQAAPPSVDRKTPSL